MPAGRAPAGALLINMSLSGAHHYRFFPEYRTDCEIRPAGSRATNFGAGQAEGYPQCRLVLGKASAYIRPRVLGRRKRVENFHASHCENAPARPIGFVVETSQFWQILADAQP